MCDAKTFLSLVKAKQRENKRTFRLALSEEGSSAQPWGPGERPEAFLATSLRTPFILNLGTA